MTEHYMEFDQALLEKFRRAFSIAVKNKRKEFIFQDRTFLTDYARYMIIHMDNEFVRRAKRDVE